MQDYFRKAYGLAGSITIELTDTAPAEIPGLLTAVLQLSDGRNTQRIPVVLSRDGRFLIQGQFIDLAADPYQAAMAKISLENQPMRGNPDAPVTIVEYSDFQCPFCARAYATLEQQVLKNYGDKVRLVFKNFPLANIHPWAESAGLASACARQMSPDAFWKMYDFLFQNQSEITQQNLREKVQGVIRDAGIDVAAFENCFDNRTALDLVKADEKEGSVLGVRSTPTFFVNGHKLEGAVPYDHFKAVIDEALGVAQVGPATPAVPTPGVVSPG